MKPNVLPPPSNQSDCLAISSGSNTSQHQASHGSSMDGTHEVTALAISLMQEILATDLLPLELSRRTLNLIGQLSSLPTPSTSFLEQMSATSIYLLSTRDPAREVRRMKKLIENIDARYRNFAPDSSKNWLESISKVKTTCG